MASCCLNMHVIACIAIVLVVATPSEAARGLLSGSESQPSSAQCSDPITIYTIKADDTPKAIVNAAYSSSKISWRKLWGIISACNKEVLQGAPAGSPGDNGPKTITLHAGAKLAIPKIPARLLPKTDKPDHNDRDKYPALQKLCGCTTDLPVLKPATWQDVIAEGYPDVQPAAFAANILAMCNRQAKFVDGSDNKILAAGQTLSGICLDINGKSFKEFLADAEKAIQETRQKLAATDTSPPAAPGNAQATTGGGSVSIQADESCTVTWSSSAPVRDVNLKSGSCPVYTNGCSGPSDILAYQQQLTPCCQAHDWCYSCGWRNGLNSGNCDSLFLDNLYHACDYYYSGDAINRVACKTTADSMYAAVSLVGAGYFTNEYCPGQSILLANTNFCFNPIYTPTGAVEMNSGNGAQWGSWSSYDGAMCANTAWMDGFSMKFYSYQGFWTDDSMLNGIKMRCADRAGNLISQDNKPYPASYGEGVKGSWTSYFICPRGHHVVAFRLKVEGPQGASDDTAANLLEARCSDNTELRHPNPGTTFGSFGAWKTCPSGTAVCGFKTKIEQSSVTDYTAMNDITVACCTRP